MAARIGSRTIARPPRCRWLVAAPSCCELRDDQVFVLTMRRQFTLDDAAAGKSATCSCGMKLTVPPPIPSGVPAPPDERIQAEKDAISDNWLAQQQIAKRPADAKWPADDDILAELRQQTEHLRYIRKVGFFQLIFVLAIGLAVIEMILAHH